MVKLGFIAEGATEKIILEKSDFFNHLTSLLIDYIPEVIDANGNGNLLPHNIEKHTKVLESKGATKILILTDLDRDKCITETKTRISPKTNHIVTVSPKQIEAWFISDYDAIRKLLGDPNYTCPNPELITDPFEEIRSTRLRTIRIGARTKPALATAMISNGFSILKAAQHPQCSSAKYFLKKINELSQRP